MNEKPARFKLLLLFGFLALPAVILTTSVWIASIYTPYFKSLGQILLTFIFIVPLLILSGQLILKFISKRYLQPLELITSSMQSVLSRTFKPIPEGTDLGDYKQLYIMLTQVQNYMTQNQGYSANLSEFSAAQNKLFETSVMNISDPIILLNKKMEVVFINNAAQEVTGIKRVDSIGKSIDRVVRFYDKQNQEVLSAQYVRKKKTSADSGVFILPEAKIISNINKQSFADLNVYLPEMGDAINIACVILLQDKTKEKQLEAMKLDFVSMAAHELRTPLTSIKGYISVFMNENKDKLTPDQMMFITRINTSTQQLAGLVENLLSVSRVERGAMTLHTQVIDWVTNVKSQVDTFEHRSDEKRISLKFIEPKDPIPQVQVDLVRINEVLNNMISNAINYTEPMGKIEVWIDVKDEMVCTHIKDTGKGIPPEALPKLFGKFFRVQGGSAEQASKGNGLGLYLSKAIVELHKGVIWAESPGAGQGSTFSFSLPAVASNINIDVLTKRM